jgi:hypothetical protein
VIDTEQAMATFYDPAEFFGEQLAATRGDPERALRAAEVTHKADNFTPINITTPYGALRVHRPLGW